jgi:hypothetical protein
VRATIAAAHAALRGGSGYRRPVGSEEAKETE